MRVAAFVQARMGSSRLPSAGAPLWDVPALMRAADPAPAVPEKFP
jgi:spore coat polysaccharide biosynthesis protein SpsF (cytidylyltransferase family)